jgi:hypothetical protein
MNAYENSHAETTIPVLKHRALPVRVRACKPKYRISRLQLWPKHSSLLSPTKGLRITLRGRRNIIYNVLNLPMLFPPFVNKFEAQ